MSCLTRVVTYLTRVVFDSCRVVSDSCRVWLVSWRIWLVSCLTRVVMYVTRVVFYSCRDVSVSCPVVSESCHVVPVTACLVWWVVKTFYLSLWQLSNCMEHLTIGKVDLTNGKVLLLLKLSMLHHFLWLEMIIGVLFCSFIHLTNDMEHLTNGKVPTKKTYFNVLIHNICMSYAFKTPLVDISNHIKEKKKLPEKKNYRKSICKKIPLVYV